MTRQKREIEKQITAIYKDIAVDEQLGCGCAPTGAYDAYYRKIDELTEQLAQLRHYASAMEMFFDTRGQGIEELAFI